ncbi:MAG TPA: TRAP transporter large permease subunit, partial [Spirochaetota bacterium]|nr:TRAP transporter large permease subunit [Spirochaetota bacterium]
MIVLLLFIIIVIIAIFGAPLFSVIGATAMVNFANSGSGIMIVPQEIAKIADMPLIYSIPLFTFAGYILASSNASHRIVRLTKAALGWIPGGLAIVTLIVCALFTAFTGASGVTIIALGGFLLPGLLSEKYKEKF